MKNRQQQTYLFALPIFSILFSACLHKIEREAIFMRKSKILMQAGICVIIVMTFALARNVNIPQLNKGSAAAIAYLSKNYTVSDVMTAAANGAQAVARAPVTITNAVLAEKGQQKIGVPVDHVEEGQTVSVHAVAGGVVSAVGENDKIGNFIKIDHGDNGESIYGNCGNIQVKELQRVKKGESIATFTKEGDKDFYYSFSD